MELVTQSQNLARRQQLIDAQKQEAATRTTKQQQSRPPRAAPPGRPRGPAEDRRAACKVEKARREAWHVQAHWQSPAGIGSARWNEPRTRRTRPERSAAAAALSPAPPAVPSPSVAAASLSRSTHARRRALRLARRHTEHASDQSGTLLCGLARHHLESCAFNPCECY